MAMQKQQKQLYEFGPYRIDASERILIREGQPVALAPKAFDTLLVLVENSGHVVDKEELMSRVWPDTFVEEVNLAVNVSSVRKVLGARPDGRQYIETVPKRGYRFVADIRKVEIDLNDLLLKEHIQSSIEVTTELTGHEDEGAQEIPREEVSRYRATATSYEDSRRQADAGQMSVIRRYKTRAAIIAALLVVAVAAAFLHFSRKAALTEKDTILVADFINTTGDSVFDPTLKQALAVQLQQSPFLSMFSDQRVQETLRYMSRSPDERVTGAVAREICERQGIKAMLTGSIASLGSHYVITLEALNAQTGDVLAREQVEAERKEQVLRKLGEAASRLREKVGESISTMRRFDAPIEQATTTSLDALKAYSLGRQQHNRGDWSGAVPLYKHAIELDPDFALAYGGLAALHNNLFQFDLADQYGRKAFDLRSRLSERERLYISSNTTCT